MKERRALKIRKLVVLSIVLTVWIALSCINAYGMCIVIVGEEGEGSWVSLSWALQVFFFGTPLVLTWILRFPCDCRVSEYNGHEIVVYYGRQHKYMKVDDEVVDRDARVLKCTLEDGTQIEARKPILKPIILKINDKIYTQECK